MECEQRPSARASMLPPFFSQVHRGPSFGQTPIEPWDLHVGAQLRLLGRRMTLQKVRQQRAGQAALVWPELWWANAACSRRCRVCASGGIGCRVHSLVGQGSSRCQRVLRVCFGWAVQQMVQAVGVGCILWCGSAAASAGCMQGACKITNQGRHS
eukprot:1161386-Pelagomonas_calceolata.AAC.5